MKDESWLGGRDNKRSNIKVVFSQKTGTFHFALTMIRFSLQACAKFYLSLGDPHGFLVKDVL